MRFWALLYSVRSAAALPSQCAARLRLLLSAQRYHRRQRRGSRGRHHGGDECGHASAAAATLNATGSQKDTPYSCADSRYPAPQRGAPEHQPESDTRERSTQYQADHAATIGASAMRRPISLRRRATVYAVTP
jgi:hypothetical protein